VADKEAALPGRGELLKSELSFRWVDPRPIEEGEFLVPARISGKAGREFAALNMILNDLSFALECFAEADKLGIPDASSSLSKALVFSAVVAYARPFMTGVREVKLEPSFFADLAESFDPSLHAYLIDLRNKHIAHSVNEFERCETVALMVGTPATGWRIGGGIGVSETQAVGLPRDHVQKAVTHITNSLNFLRDIVERKRAELYQEFKAQFEKDRRWEIAPIVRMPDRTQASRRRKD
jgi:hypothetical protein